MNVLNIRNIMALNWQPKITVEFYSSLLPQEFTLVTLCRYHAPCCSQSLALSMIYIYYVVLTLIWWFNKWNDCYQGFLMKNMDSKCIVTKHNPGIYDGACIAHIHEGSKWISIPYIKLMGANSRTV